MKPVPGIDIYASDEDMAEHFGTEEERHACALCHGLGWVPDRIASPCPSGCSVSPKRVDE